jgi:uncharacterized membrane protein YgcG
MTARTSDTQQLSVISKNDNNTNASLQTASSTEQPQSKQLTEDLHADVKKSTDAEKTANFATGRSDSHSTVTPKPSSAKSHQKQQKQQSRPSLKRSRSKAASSLTATLIRLSIMFLLLTLPVCVWLVLVGNDYVIYGVDVSTDAWLNMAWAVVNMLWYSNAALNFYVYVLTGTRFRSQCRRIVCPCRKQKMKNTKTSGAASHAQNDSSLRTTKSSLSATSSVGLDTRKSAGVDGGGGGGGGGNVGSDSGGENGHDQSNESSF